MLDALPLGDLVICIPVVLQEALEQKKTAQNHFAHLFSSWGSTFTWL